MMPGSDVTTNKSELAVITNPSKSQVNVPLALREWKDLGSKTHGQDVDMMQMWRGRSKVLVHILATKLIWCSKAKQRTTVDT